MHQKPSSRIPAALRQTPSDWIHVVVWQTPSDWVHVVLWQIPSNQLHVALWQTQLYQIRFKICIWVYNTIVPFLLRLERRTCRWTPCVLSVESREVTMIGNTWGSHGNFLGISARAMHLAMRPYDQRLTQWMDKYQMTVFHQIRFKIFIWVYNIR